MNILIPSDSSSESYEEYNEPASTLDVRSGDKVASIGNKKQTRQKKKAKTASAAPTPGTDAEIPDKNAEEELGEYYL